MANRSLPKTRVTCPVVYVASELTTAAGTTDGPPTTTMRPGASRSSSALTEAAMPPVLTSRTGAWSRPATAAAAIASGKVSPEATYATATPGLNVAADTAAEVSKRVEPASRSTVGAAAEAALVQCHRCGTATGQQAEADGGGGSPSEGCAAATWTL